MSNGVLARLRDDHKRFERFLVAIDDNCVRAEKGEKINFLRLRAIAAYLSTYGLPPHHALEDALFAQMVQIFPHFQTEIFDLAEDHQTGRRELQIFAGAVEREDKSFIEPARSFVANERGHFIAEEEIVFPYAAKSFAAGRLHITDENAASAGPIPEHILNLVQDLVS